MISVHGVTKRFGSLVAVDEVSFDVRRGEIVGFLGPNGAGKTTTMRMLTGSLEPDEGQILFDGTPIQEDLRSAKARVGYLPESNPLYDDMLVCEYLEFVADLRGMAPDTARTGISDAVAETGLEDVFFRPISELSKGYRQRTGMAGAILHKPEILILDEPTEGLDPNQRVEIRKLVHALGTERTVFLSTHVMQEVEQTCNRILILRNGSLAADSTMEGLERAQRGVARYVVEVAGNEVETVLRQLPGVSDVQGEKEDSRERFTIDSQGEDDLRPLLFKAAKDQGWELWELRREQATLEQLFRDLTADKQSEDPAESEDDQPTESPGEQPAESGDDQ